MGSRLRVSARIGTASISTLKPGLNYKATCSAVRPLSVLRAARASISSVASPQGRSFVDGCNQGFSNALIVGRPGPLLRELRTVVPNQDHFRFAPKGASVPNSSVRPLAILHPCLSNLLRCSLQIGGTRCRCISRSSRPAKELTPEAGRRTWHYLAQRRDRDAAPLPHRHSHRLLHRRQLRQQGPDGLHDRGAAP